MGPKRGVFGMGRAALGAAVMMAFVVCSCTARSLLYESKVPGGDQDPIYLGYDTTDDYKAKRLSAVATPGVAIAITFAVLGIICGIFNCVGKCGKGGLQEPKCFQSLCCTGPPKPSSKTTRTILGVYVILVICCFIAAACVYSVGFNDMKDGTNNLMSLLAEECAEMRRMTTSLEETMKALNQEPNSEAMTAATQRVCDAISTTQNDLSDGFDTGGILMITFWTVMCLFPMLGIISWCTGRGSWAVALVVFSWILMCVAWFFFGVAWFQAAWLDDTCVQMQNWYDCKSPAYVFAAMQGKPMDPKCTPAQLTLASSGALSKDENLCPDFASVTSNSSAHASASYWSSIYEENWNKLQSTVILYNSFWDPPGTGTGGPSFGIHFLPPGSKSPPIRCHDPNPGSSCVYANQSSAYPNVTALRKFYYDAEGGHYDSMIKKCSTLKNTSTAVGGEHSWDAYSVLPPTDYSASCVTSNFCLMNASTGLFAKPLSKKDPSNGKLEATIPKYCFEKAILTLSDAMWQASYMASCAYVATAAEKIVASDGPCDKAGNGFVYVFASTAFAAVIWLIMLIVAYLGMNAWDEANYEEKCRPKANGKNGDTTHDDPVKGHTEVDLGGDIEKKDFTDIS